MNKTLKQAIYKKECILTSFKSVETLKMGKIQAAEKFSYKTQKKIY